MKEETPSNQTMPEHLLDIELKHGSLAIMYGDFQHKYEHAILKEKTRKNARINLTFRVVK